MRTSFARERTAHLRASTGEQAPKRHEWRYYQAMSFLKDITDPPVPCAPLEPLITLEESPNELSPAEGDDHFQSNLLLHHHHYSLHHNHHQMMMYDSGSPSSQLLQQSLPPPPPLHPVGLARPRNRNKKPPSTRTTRTTRNPKSSAISGGGAGQKRSEFIISNDSNGEDQESLSPSGLYPLLSINGNNTNNSNYANESSLTFKSNGFNEQSGNNHCELPKTINLNSSSNGTSGWFSFSMHYSFVFDSQINRMLEIDKKIQFLLVRLNIESRDKPFSVACSFLI